MKKRNVMFFSAIVFAVGLSMSNAYGSEEVCVSQQSLAENAMKLRQGGVDRSVVDTVVYSESGQAIVTMAYERAIVPENVKQYAVSGFASHIYSLCKSAWAEAVDVK